MSEVLYLVLEGPDYSGKGTQMDLLCSRVSQKNLPFIRVFEPGFTESGRELRKIVKDPHLQRSLSPLATLTLFCADRIVTLRTVVLPALNSGKVVISDRCFLSSIAYQGAGQGVDPEIVRKMNEAAVGPVLPTVVLLLQLPTTEIVKRRDVANRQKQRSDDFFDERPAEFFDAVQASYASQIGNWPFPIIPIDAMGSPQEVHGRVVEALSGYLSSIT